MAASVDATNIAGTSSGRQSSPSSSNSPGSVSNSSTTTEYFSARSKSSDTVNPPRHDVTVDLEHRDGAGRPSAPPPLCYNDLNGDQGRAHDHLKPADDSDDRGATLVALSHNQYPNAVMEDNGSAAGDESSERSDGANSGLGERQSTAPDTPGAEDPTVRTELQDQQGQPSPAMATLTTGDTEAGTSADDAASDSGRPFPSWPSKGRHTLIPTVLIERSNVSGNGPGSTGPGHVVCTEKTLRKIDKTVDDVAIELPFMLRILVILAPLDLSAIIIAFVVGLFSSASDSECRITAVPAQNTAFNPGLISDVEDLCGSEQASNFRQLILLCFWGLTTTAFLSAMFSSVYRFRAKSAYGALVDFGRELRTLRDVPNDGSIDSKHTRWWTSAPYLALMMTLCVGVLLVFMSLELHCICASRHGWDILSNQYFGKCDSTDPERDIEAMVATSASISGPVDISVSCAASSSTLSVLPVYIILSFAVVALRFTVMLTFFLSNSWDGICHAVRSWWKKLTLPTFANRSWWQWLGMVVLFPLTILCKSLCAIHRALRGFSPDSIRRAICDAIPFYSDTAVSRALMPYPSNILSVQPSPLRISAIYYALSLESNRNHHPYFSYHKGSVVVKGINQRYASDKNLVVLHDDGTKPRFPEESDAGGGKSRFYSAWRDLIGSDGLRPHHGDKAIGLLFYCMFHFGLLSMFGGKNPKDWKTVATDLFEVLDDKGKCNLRMLISGPVAVDVKFFDGTSHFADIFVEFILALRAVTLPEKTTDPA